MKLLLNLGFDLNVVDKYNRNLIHYVCINGTAEMASVVSEHLKYLINKN